MQFQSNRQAGRDFVRRTFLPRTLGCALSFLYIAVEIHGDDPAGWIWGWMLLNGFAWPSVAKLLALRSANPYQAELRNLLVDSLFAGGWIMIMHASLLPSALLLSMVSMHNVAANGLRLLVKGLTASLLGALLFGLLNDFRIDLETSQATALACLPMLFLYPLSVGWTSYRLAARLAEQRRALSILLARDAWMLALGLAFQRCRSRSIHATLGLLRIDELPGLRNSHGRLVSQALATRLLQLSKLETRQADIIGVRQPGELAIIFHQTRLSGAQQCLERIAEQFSNFGPEGAALANLSISIAAVEYRFDFVSEIDWLEASELRLGEDPQREARLRLARA